MKKLLALLLAAMLVLGGTALADDDLYYLLGYGIGGDTQGPITGWIGDLWAREGFQLEAVGSGNTEEQMQIMLASGDLQDVVRFANWVDYETAVQAGYLLNLDEYIDQLPNSTTYIPEALEFTRDVHSAGTGNLYGIPCTVGRNSYGIDFDCYCFNLRWDIYAQAGYPQAETLEDMVDVLKAMKEVYPKNEDGLETYALNMFAAWDGTSRFSFANAVLTTIGYYEGGQKWCIEYNIPERKASSMFEDGAFKRACHFLFLLNQAGLVDPDALTQEYTTSQSKIASGQYFGCWWGGYKSAFDTAERKNSDPPVGFEPVLFGEFMTSQLGDYPVGASWPICVSANAKDIDKCLRFIDLNSDPYFVFELQNGPKGMFWDEKEDGTTYATDLWYERYEKGGYYTNENGEEVKWESFNGRYNLRGNLIYDQNLLDTGYRDETREYSNNNKLLDAWSEYYGGEYKFPMDYALAHDMVAKNPLALDQLMPNLPDDLQLIHDAVGAVVQQKGWQMVYAADEAEFEALWQSMVADAEALGAEQVQQWAYDNIAAAEELAAKYEYKN